MSIHSLRELENTRRFRVPKLTSLKVSSAQSKFWTAAACCRFRSNSLLLDGSFPTRSQAPLGDEWTRSKSRLVGRESAQNRTRCE